MENNMYSKVFGWMFLGLFITFGTGLILSAYPQAIVNILGGSGLIIIVILEMALAIFFGFRIKKMSKPTAIFCYLLYSLLTGITFSVLFLAFELSSMMSIFGITALVFGIFAVFGAVTNIPLNKISTFLFMGLIAIIIASIINMFVGNETFSLGLCILGIVIFLGYIAYDIQKIPLLLEELGDDKGAIYGAFELYLDFINLFIRLLSLFGKSRD